MNIVPEEYLLESNYTVFLQEMESSTLTDFSDVWTLYVKEGKKSPAPPAPILWVCILLFIYFITI